MKREDVIYFANCLKHNYTIDFNTMEMFCNEVIKSQKKLQKIEDIMNDVTVGFDDIETVYYSIAEVLYD